MDNIVDNNVIENKTNSEKPTKKDKTWVRVLKWVSSIFIILFIVATCWMLIDRISNYNFPFFGLRASVISSPSMASVNSEYEDFLKGRDDRLYVNDLIFTYKVDSIEDLNVYDIITFVNDDNELICHRIIEINVEDNKIWTRGDANNKLDGVVEFEEVKGRYIGKIPGIGVVTLYLNSAYGLLGVSIAFTFIFGGAIILELDKHKKKNDDKVLAKQEENKNNTISYTTNNEKSLDSKQESISNKAEKNTADENVSKKNKNNDEIDDITKDDFYEL